MQVVQDLGALWTLTKDGHDARADVRGIEGVGFELRYVWDGELRVSEVRETGDIEVGPPHGYKGPFNHLAFRDAAERYFRSLVGSTASGIRIQGGGNIRMRNNRFTVTRVETFEIEGGSSGAW